MFRFAVKHSGDPLPQKTVRLPKSVRKRHTLDAFAEVPVSPEMSAARARIAKRCLCWPLPSMESARFNPHRTIVGTLPVPSPDPPPETP